MGGIAYFDNAATTYKKPEEVHEFMREFYSANSVNVGRGNHGLLSESNRIVIETRKMLLRLFNATNDYEAIFTPTATEAINIVLQGQRWEKNDTIYISPFEHNAVYRTVKYLEKKYNLEVIILQHDPKSLEIDKDAIAFQFATKPPKFVAATHVSNVCGNILDIVSLGEMAKKYNARYLVDCAQSAGLLETNIIKTQADYMVFAGHKTLYGPFGCSGFICKKQSAPNPLIYGGTGIDSANEDMPSFLPARLEAGSVNIMAISGLYKSLQWINNIGIDEIKEKETNNYKKLLKLLKRYDFINIIGEGRNNTSIISCRFDELSPDNIGEIMSKNGVIVRTGLHCAPIAHKTLGTFPEGTVRFSVSYFTSEKDFQILKNILDTLYNCD